LLIACSNDQKVYIDLGFYQELRQRFGAPGDFAQAYVIAHELGHHVQNLLGRTRLVHDAPESSQDGPRGLSVRLELQADCYAGIWANRANAEHQILEAGDIEEGLNAAAAVGDDRLQMRSRGYVVPESFTHGSSQQRQQWFKRGLQTGDVAACDTFATR
jgi:predicted metalloprotease